MTETQRARTADEYVDLVRQAVFEVDDVDACPAWDHAGSTRAIQHANGELPSAQRLGHIGATHRPGLVVAAV